MFYYIWLQLKVMRLNSFIILALMLTTIPANAQKIAGIDSTSAFKAAHLIAPSILIGSGFAIHYAAHDTWDMAVNEKMQEWNGGKSDPCFDDYIQYVPLAMDLGLGLTGVKAGHCFIDRAIEGALAYASCGIISGLSRELIYSPRPNGYNTKSFPSGHCAFVFTSAELVRKEYGWGWGAGAYGIATAVAVMRLYRNWHWLSDVLYGAGIGILSANIGCWLLEPTKKLFGINIPENLQIGIAPGYDPYSGATYAAVTMKF